MNYEKLSGSIRAVIDRRPRDNGAYNDLFSLCREWETEDFSAAHIADMVKKIYGAHAPTDGLCLWCDAVTMFQINADAVQNGLTVVPAARNINGISLSSVVTPIGVVYLYLGEYLPAGTALLLNLSVLAPVYQPVPGKGNFFLEPLAKVGAGEKYQLFGQIGLDHGPEWFHGKFTGISTEFTAPTYSRSVFIANDANNPVNTKAVAGG